MKKYLVALFVLFLSVGAFAADSFTVKMGVHFVVRTSDQRITIHIPFREQNRSIEYAWEGVTEDGNPTDAGSTVIELVEGDHITKQVTFERWMKHPAVGLYVVQVIIHATDGDIGPIRAEFEVK